MMSLPNLAAHNQTDERGAYVELSAQRYAGCPTGMLDSNFLCLLIGQLCHTVFFSVRHAPLRYAIVRIVLRRSKEQMIRSHARWVVAPMARLKAVWYWTVGLFPRVAVRSLRHAVVIEDAVPAALSVDASSVDPAAARMAGLVNERPEALRCLGVHAGTAAFRRAEAEAVRRGWLQVHRLSAPLTRFLDAVRCLSLPFMRAIERAESSARATGKRFEFSGATTTSFRD